MSLAILGGVEENVWGRILEPDSQWPWEEDSAGSHRSVEKNSVCVRRPALRAGRLRRKEKFFLLKHKKFSKTKIQRSGKIWFLHV